MHSPFFMKMHFYLPSTPSAAAKNVANVIYIATRPGADRGDLEPELSPEERNPNELSLEGALGPVEIDPGTAAGHVKYSAERPGSHGLFDADGTANLQAACDELKGHQGIVWRDIISLHEDDAARLGYTTREKWEEAIRRVMPDVAKSMGIGESNFRWVAAYHYKEGHPHCHISFWEKNPERTRGKISTGERRDIRKEFINVICEDERARLYLEKNEIRDLLRDQTGQELQGLGLRRYLRQEKLEIAAEHGGRPGPVPILDDEARSQLKSRLEEIARAMPGHGRAALKYMPEEVKAKVRETADWLLRQPGFADQAGRYQDLAKELAGHYAKQPEALDQAARKARDDIRDRAAQLVLKGAAEINQVERGADRAAGRAAHDVTSAAARVWSSVFRGVERERQKAEAMGKLDERKRKLREQQQQYQYEYGGYER